jgi:hypothetical protein
MRTEGPLAFYDDEICLKSSAEQEPNFQDAQCKCVLWKQRPSQMERQNYKNQLARMPGGRRSVKRCSMYYSRIDENKYF